MWSRPGYLIRRLHQIHVALFLAECRAFNLTQVQYGVLTALAQRGELNLGSLAEEVGIDRVTVAGVLSRLHRRGLVRRRPDPKDRRARLAEVTARGRSMTIAVFNGMQRTQDRLCAPLTPAQRDSFIATLALLVRANNEHGRGVLRMD